MMGGEKAQMADNEFSYDKWVAEALRGVLRRALIETARNGLPGDHHFYINFRTSDEGVTIPPFLRAQYPNEITIALQHQFDGLSVDEAGFDVRLSFGGRKHDLHVPFEAVTSFADPSVNFGLQIVTAATNGPAEAKQTSSPLQADENREDEAGGDEAARPVVSAEVIALDSFRKH